MWENTFLVTCAFLGDDVETARAHLGETVVPTSLALLRSASKLDRARALAAEVDAVKRALDAMEAPWR